jgi:predicted lipid carrier protein YhbT
MRLRTSYGGIAVPTATENFFADLDRRGREPLLERVAGRLRFDVDSGTKPKRWMVVIDHGDLTVSHENRPADCSVRIEAAVFEDIVTGVDNAMAATLRGALAIEGDLELLLLFQRLFPGPHGESVAPRRDGG